MQFNKFEKIHACTIFIIGISLLVLHTFYNSKFLVDAISISILILLTILPYLKYVSKISFQGISLELEREVKDASEKVEEFIDDEQIQKAQNLDEQFNAFVKLIEEIMHKDPNAAIMKLRTELEISIRQFYNLVIPNNNNFIPISKMVQELYKKQAIDNEAKEVTLEIVSIANKIVHGELIKQEYSLNMINTSLRLIAFYYNKFFALQSK